MIPRLEFRAAVGWAIVVPRPFPRCSGIIAVLPTKGRCLVLVRRRSIQSLVLLKGWRSISSPTRRRLGSRPYSPDKVLCSTDFPLFRLAEQYLIYIEAVARGGSGGDAGTALTYFNLLRTRAYGNASGNVGSYSLNDILNERQKELYWECFRRTDLIRYNEFTSSNYLWPWKGGVIGGTGVDAHLNLLPLPATELNSNPSLVQNPGY